MKKEIILLALLLVAVSQGTYAQLTIFGSVVDAETGNGIPGASVVVKETIIGGVTNSSGNFAIMNVPNDAILQVSYIGYKTVEIPVENQTRFEITLEPDVQVLGDVVVTAERNQIEKIEVAMGMIRDKNSLTTAVYHISGDEMRKGGSRSFAEALVGRVPSLQTYIDIDGYVKVAYLRAIISFQGSKPPLFVLDGMPLADDPTPWLNIEAIESVTVLPSANAAILYGSAGANGAIIITMKKR